MNTFFSFYTILYSLVNCNIPGGIALQKIHELKQTLKENSIQNMIVSDPLSIRYLVGYHTEPGERLLVLIITPQDNHLILNNLFPKHDSIDDLNVLYYQDGEPIMKVISNLLAEGVTSIDKFWPSHFLLELMAIKKDLQPLNASHILDDIRAIKSSEEIALMREASLLNDQVMEQLIDALKQGLTEAEYGDLLKTYYQELGHDGFSFEPIVAYGANGADPHHTTDNSSPQKGDAVVLDIGGIYKGYASDMTRTVFYGQPSEEALKVYDIVHRANLAGIAAVKAGTPLSQIDLAARAVIEEAGYGQYFTHRLGHFIGQEAHEAGDVSQYNDALAQVGQVFSIEPGIYLPDQFGVRIEDLVVVTEDGCEVLNHVSKDPIILDVD